MGSSAIEIDHRGRDKALCRRIHPGVVISNDPMGSGDRSGHSDATYVLELHRHDTLTVSYGIVELSEAGISGRQGCRANEKDECVCAANGQLDFSPVVRGRDEVIRVHPRLGT
jgi:hypothetical protein